MGQFAGEIRMFAGNKIPADWMACDGTILDIGKHTLLFSVIGRTFGGNGISNFAVPNLQGSAALGIGQGPGLEEYHWGDVGGAVKVTLTQDQLPVHTHAAYAGPDGDQAYPAGNDWADPVANRGHLPYYASQPGTLINMHPQAITSEGNGGAHNNLMPYTTLVYCIAFEGWPPPRN